MKNRTGTLAALVASFGLFAGLWIAALATILGCPLVALAAGLAGLASLAYLANAPSITITESVETAPTARPVPSFIAGSLATGSMVAIYAAGIATMVGLPLVALGAGVVAVATIGTITVSQ